MWHVRKWGSAMGKIKQRKEKIWSQWLGGLVTTLLRVREGLIWKVSFEQRLEAERISSEVTCGKNGLRRENIRARWPPWLEQSEGESSRAGKGGKVGSGKYKSCGILLATVKTFFFHFEMGSHCRVLSRRMTGVNTVNLFWETVSVIQMRNDGGLDQGGSSKCGEKWWHSAYILKVAQDFLVGKTWGVRKGLKRGFQVNSGNFSIFQRLKET